MRKEVESSKELENLGKATLQEMEALKEICSSHADLSQFFYADSLSVENGLCSFCPSKC